MKTIEEKMAELEKEYTNPTADLSENKELFVVQATNRALFAILKKEIVAANYENAIGIVEDFRKEMDDFACKAKTSTANTMCLCGYDMATYVLDYLIA